MKLSERVQLMKEAYEVAQTFQMDLKGKFYRIKNMRQNDEYQLEKFLFTKQEKKSYSYSAGNYSSKK